MPLAIFSIISPSPKLWMVELSVNTPTNGFPVSSVLCVVLELREGSRYQIG